MSFSKTAIVLAGGRGTRLGSLTENIPKPLLNVAERPFIFHLLDYLKAQKISNVILAIGYLQSQFEQLIGKEYKGMSVRYSIETSPLGTGGALDKALSITNEENLFVLNGDTLFMADLRELEQKHHQVKASLTLVLRHVEDAARYGSIDFNNELITSIREKGTQGPGYINGGIYFLRLSERPSFKKEVYSFEKEVIPFLIKNNKVSFVISNNYFIDIGIPEDFQRSQVELNNKFIV